MTTLAELARIRAERVAKVLMPKKPKGRLAKEST